MKDVDFPHPSQVADTLADIGISQRDEESEIDAAVRETEASRFTPSAVVLAPHTSAIRETRPPPGTIKRGKGVIL
jgi:hypothetical protein